MLVTFSIIVPVYNVEKYLNKCLDSILNQEFQNYEIILVNDGSTDRSSKICENYKENYNNVKVIHKSNEGLSEARNDGIKISEGKYILFIDSDDWLLDDSLEKANNCIEKFGELDILINKISYYYEELGVLQECPYEFRIEKMKNMKPEDVFNTLYNTPHFLTSACIFIVRREYINKNNLFFSKGLLHEDEEWVPRVILNAKNIHYNNSDFYCNRANRKGSITQTINIKREYDKLEIIDKLLKESKKAIYNQDQKLILISRSSILLMSSIVNLPLYKKVSKDDYNDLTYKLKSKSKMLLFSKKKVHSVTYILCKVIGMGLTSEIIRMLINFKNTLTTNR